MEVFVNFTEIWKFFKKNLLRLAIVAVAVAMIGGVASVYFMSNQYSTSSMIVITCEVPEDAGTDYRLQYTSILNSRVQTAVAMANAHSLIETTAKNLGIDKDKIISMGATQVNTAPVIKLTINCNDYTLANKIADTAAQALSQQMMDTFPSPRLTAVVSDKAVPAGPNSIKAVAMKGAMMGGALGVLLVLCFGILKVLLDRTIRNTAYVTETMKLPLLGALTHQHDERRRLDELRKLRAAFLSTVEHGACVMITSPCPRSGVTEAALGLATALTLSGNCVLLVDVDLEEQSMAKRLKVSPAKSIADVLAGECTQADAICETGTHNLSFLGGRAPGLSGADLMSSPKFAELLASCRMGFDYVLVDAPAERLRPDADCAAAATDAVLLVAKYGATPYAEFRESCVRLESAGGRVVGFVATNL